MSALADLWTSTANLHKRFDYTPTLDDRGRVFFEEIWEFIHAIEFINSDSPAEAADVLVTVLGLLQGMGYEYIDIEKAIRATIHKNDAKTTDTHYVNAKGKISRREGQ